MATRMYAIRPNDAYGIIPTTENRQCFGSANATLRLSLSAARSARRRQQTTDNASAPLHSAQHSADNRQRTTDNG